MGRELLEGAVLDRNANFMASNATQHGFRVRSIQVIDDIEEDAVAAFRAALALQPSFLFVTGGMGPGLDDVTRECVAKATERPLVVDETAKRHLAASYRRLVAHGIVSDAVMTDERLKMATVPEGSMCFENPIGTAPAIHLEIGQTVLFLLPGQPEELRRMFTSYALPVLEAEGPEGYRMTSQVEYPGGDESAISRMLADLARRHPGIHSRARLRGGDPEVRIRISLAAEGPDQESVKALVDAATADLRARLGLEVGGSTAGESYLE